MISLPQLLQNGYRNRLNPAAVLCYTVFRKTGDKRVVMRARILVIEDELAISDLICMNRVEGE